MALAYHFRISRTYSGLLRMLAGLLLEVSCVAHRWSGH